MQNGNMIINSFSQFNVFDILYQLNVSRMTKCHAVLLHHDKMITLFSFWILSEIFQEIDKEIKKFFLFA